MRRVAMISYAVMLATAVMAVQPPPEPQQISTDASSTRSYVPFLRVWKPKDIRIAVSCTWVLC